MTLRRGLNGLGRLFGGIGLRNGHVVLLLVIIAQLDVGRVLVDAVVDLLSLTGDDQGVFDGLDVLHSLAVVQRPLLVHKAAEETDVLDASWSLLLGHPQDDDVVL